MNLSPCSPRALLIPRDPGTIAFGFPACKISLLPGMHLRAGFCSFDLKYSPKVPPLFHSLKVVNSIYFTAFFFFIKYKNLGSIPMTRVSYTLIFQSNANVCGFVLSLFRHSPCVRPSSYPQLDPYLYPSPKHRRAALAGSHPYGCCAHHTTWLSFPPSALMSWRLYPKDLGLTLPATTNSIGSKDSLFSEQSPALMLPPPARLLPLLVLL